jgi:hypothetical protein
VREGVRQPRRRKLRLVRRRQEVRSRERYPIGRRFGIPGGTGDFRDGTVMTRCLSRRGVKQPGRRNTVRTVAARRGGKSIWLAAIFAGLALAALLATSWPVLSAAAQQGTGAGSGPRFQPAPVLAWYYAEFSQGAEQDIANARRAGIDALIISQTTQRPGEALFTTALAKAAEGTDISLTLGIETNLVYESQAELVAELKRILRDEAPNPRFLRYAGKPVIVFWHLPAIKTLPGQSPQAAWESVRAQVDPGRTSLWIAEGGDPAPGTGTLTYLPSFDALHLYSIAWDADPVRALTSWAQRTRGTPGGKLWVATVMPGGFYAEGPPPWKHRDRENGGYFERSWRGALATNPDMVILTSLNEDNEASAIQPQPEWGNLYLDINRRFSDQYHFQRNPPTPVPSPVPATPVPVTVTLQPGTTRTSVGVRPDTPSTLTLGLPGGPSVRVTIDTAFAGALQASQPDVANIEVAFDVAPIVNIPVKPEVYGGGAASVVQDGLDIKLDLLDAAGGVVAPAAPQAAAPVQITLPYYPPDPGTEFHWMYEILEDGAFIGYTWSPTETVDEVAGTVTLSLAAQDLQGTLFLPTSVTPGFVQNHDPLVHMWSGPTREARDFGFAGPQFTTFTVVAPQVATRLFVYSPIVGNFAWLDVSGVGPSGPP